MLHAVAALCNSTSLASQVGSRLELCRGSRCSSAALADSSLCGAHSGGGCYLLSQSSLLGSVRSLDLLGFAPAAGHREPPQLPSFSLGFGFLHPDCWRHVRVRWRRSRPLLEAEPALTRAATQEWAHPRASRGLRVIVDARCMPFLLDGSVGPRALAKDGVRREAVVVTVVEPSGRERRAHVVQRVVVSPDAAAALLAARRAHAAAVSPLLQTPEEAGEGEGGAADGGSATSSLLAELRERSEARQRRRLTAWRLIALNCAVLALNGLIAVRGVALWALLQRLRVEEWIHRARPHVGTTLQAMRVLNWVTLPVRWPLARLPRPGR